MLTHTFNEGIFPIKSLLGSINEDKAYCPFPLLGVSICLCSGTGTRNVQGGEAALAKSDPEAGLN
jgi:hypothetical protein